MKTKLPSFIVAGEEPEEDTPVEENNEEDAEEN